MPDGNNLTIDFNDSSFDTSQGDVQPVPNIDVDVVFPLDDNPDLTVASGASDNRTSTAAPASAIALMPTDGMSSSMEEFLFEFDNDLNDDGTADDQGLKVTTSGGSGGQQVVNHINLQGTLENLHTDGSLDIYVSDKDANGNQVFEKVTLGEGSDTSGNDNITYVGGDTNGGDTGAGDDIVSINVDASATMGGTFLSICQEDWGTPMEELARDSLGLVEFDLSQRPIEDTIWVTVDGVASTDWIYDDGDQSIIFTVPPPEGSEIVINYAIWPECN